MGQSNLKCEDWYIHRNVLKDESCIGRSEHFYVSWIDQINKWIECGRINVTKSGDGTGGSTTLELTDNGDGTAAVVFNGSVLGSVVTEDTDTNTDNQSLSFNPATGELFITGGNSVTIPITEQDTYSFSFEESTRTFSVSRNGVGISDFNIGDSDSQTISYDAETGVLSISNGNQVTIPKTVVPEYTHSFNAESRVLTIYKDGVVFEEITIPDQDQQNLTFNSNTRVLGITGGNTISLPEETDPVYAFTFNASTRIFEVKKDGDVIASFEIPDESGIDAIVVDGTTITGEGSTNNPFVAPFQPVSVGPGLSGDGTPGNPLTALTNGGSGNSNAYTEYFAKIGDSKIVWVGTTTAQPVFNKNTATNEITITFPANAYPRSITVDVVSAEYTVSAEHLYLKVDFDDHINNPFWEVEADQFYRRKYEEFPGRAEGDEWLNGYDNAPSPKRKVTRFQNGETEYMWVNGFTAQKQSLILKY